MFTTVLQEDVTLKGFDTEKRRKTLRKLTLLSIILISILTISIRVNAEMTLEIVSGNNQVGLVGHPLKNSFKVQVKENGNPLPNEVVLFGVLSGGGSLIEDSSNPITNSGMSDAEGIVTKHLMLGPDVGENSIEAYFYDPDDNKIEVLFTVEGTIPITDIPDPTDFLIFRPGIYRKYLGLPTFFGWPYSDEVPDLVDHSYAGYKNGAQGIPEDFGYPIYDVTDYGAIPDDNMSDYSAIKAAIAAAPSNSGAIIFFPPGQYDVLMDGDSSNGIWIKKDNVIIQGSGAQGYSHGGTTIKIHNELSQYNALFMANWGKGGSGSSQITGSFPRGTKYFDVEDASELGNPKFIKIRADDLLGDDWDDHCSVAPDDMPSNFAMSKSGVKIAEIHEIDYIEENRIYIKAPTLTPLNDKYKVSTNNLKVGIGFQDLHINCNLEEPYQHLVQTGRSGIHMDYVAHSWIRRCRFSNAVLAFRSVNSYCTSAIGIISDGRSGHYTSGLTDQSTYCFIGLLEDYTYPSSSHGSSVIKYTAGTVLWRVGGSSLRGPDAHGAQPRHSLFDNYRSITHESSSGISASYPQHLDGYTYWNCTTTDNVTFDLWAWNSDGNRRMYATQANIIGYKTEGGDEPIDAYVEAFERSVHPFSLYEDQLSHRPDADDSWIAEAKEMYGEFFREVFISDYDSNNHPRFTNGGLTELSIFENMGSGVNVGDPIVAIDGDGDTITYSITGRGNVMSAFSIVETSGQLKTKASLDFETDNLYSVITVVASDGKGGTGQTTAIVKLIDIHDNFVPVVDRTPQVRDAIVAAVEGIDTASDITKSHLEGITYLNISHKGISELKKGDFSGLTQLKFLDLGNSPHLGNKNQLSALPIDIFSELRSLKRLFLNYNQLETLQQRSFIGLQSLEAFSASGNQLSSLPKDLFFGLDFYELNLSYNNLQVLQHETFSGLSKLKLLYLRYNNLTSLPPKLFYGLSGAEVLKSLQLQGNPTDPIQIPIQLEKVGSNKFKAVISTGAPFNISLSVLGSGNIYIEEGGLIRIDQGQVESSLFTTKHSGSVYIKNGSVSSIPRQHHGYELNTVEDLLTFGSSNAPILQDQQNIPLETSILPNYPNPFNPETWIPYQLSKSSPVSIAIYNIRGSIVRKLELGHQRAGYYTSKSRAAYWDGRNKLGESVSSGIYFYEFQADGESLLRKMVIIR